MSLVQMDRFGSVFVARPLLAAGLLPSRPGIPILMYHSVSNDPEPGVSPYYRLATSPSRFREQMTWLHQNGYRTLGLVEAVRRLSTGALNGDRFVVLTFDDGFADFAYYAWPILQEFDFTATVFLPTAFIGRIRRSFKGRECLTWSDVRRLHDAGIAFGSHTVTHRKLYGLSWDEVDRELAESRATLEDQLQVPANTFAYPYAFPQEDRNFATRFRAVLEQHAYAACVTTVIGRASRSSHSLSLERLPINDADERALFAAKMAGAYDWLGRVQFLSRYARAIVK